MNGLPQFSRLFAALALVAPAMAQAAPVAPARNATATATITPPASVRKLNDLYFAYLTVTTAGTAIVNPNTEALTTTGGVLAAGGVPYSALFEAVSPVKNVVIIRIPKTATTVTRVGGAETMTVDTWTLAGTSSRNVVAKEPF